MCQFADGQFTPGARARVLRSDAKSLPISSEERGQTSLHHHLASSFFLTLTAIFLAGCGGGSSSGGSGSQPQPNPTPSITSVSPTSVTAGGSGFTLTVNGSNFISSSVIQWNSGALTTSYASATQLTASIPAADITSGQNASITVVNPAPGGGTSSSVPFAVNDPVPTISSLTPSSALAGGAAFTLTVNGSGFLSSSVVQWNGNSRTTTYISGTQLSISISAADIAVGQTAVVSVTNPSPGGGTSAEASIPVNSPSPTLASISPSSATAAGAAFTLTVNGSGFLQGSAVQWNGSYGQPPLATTYVSSSELTVVIPANDIAFAGVANVTVVNPTPGGGTSGAATFTINGSLPSDVSFVAPNGSDNNPGTITQPYLTIQKCATTVSSGETCAIRAGIYRETVTPNSGITITSYDGEPVTVDGSNPVTGWTLYQGSIYQTSVALSLSDGNQIFVANQMMTEARWPNGNDLFHVNWATLGTGTTTTTLVDPNLPNINWTGAKIHFWSGPDPNSSQTGTVTGSSQGQLTFTLDGADNGYQQPEPGGYYYLYRLRAAMDTQNEWYYDPNAMILYFWAPGNANPSSLNIRAKQRQYAFDLSGQSNVVIEHVDLFASTINSNSASTNDIIDGIDAQYVSHYTDLPDPPGAPGTFPADYSLDTGIVLNGTNDLLENSAISWSAGTGVAMNGQNNTVTNTLIHHVDYMANQGAGINVTDSGQTVRSNTIYNCGRIGIFVEGTVDIGYNNVFSCMMLSRDAGEVYTYNLYGDGSIVHNNWLHDTQSLYPGSAYNFSLPGVYLDNYATGWSVYQNVLWNNEFSNIFLNGGYGSTVEPNPPPENNNIYNNSIPDVGNNAFILLSDIVNCGTTQLTNNLILTPTQQQNSSTLCSATTNNSAAPGATQMTSAVQVGCNFAGCSSEGPPAISGTSVSASIAVQPYGKTVTAGQPVMFSVTGAGSPTLTYQWQRNGASITGATSTTYSITATSAADNGAMFTVTVSNSLGSVTSIPAVLTVQ